MLTDETLSPDGLEELLEDVRGATPVTLVTETYPKRYAGTPEVMKRSEINGMLNADYEKSVNRQLDRENKSPDFKAGTLPWGIKVSKTCLVIHKGKTYVRVQVLAAREPKYFVEGQEVDKEEIQEYLYPSRKPTNQGTDKPVRPRTYEISPGNCRVKAIAINGRKIEIV